MLLYFNYFKQKNDDCKSISHFNCKICHTTITADLNKKIFQQNPPESLNLFLAPGNITDQSQIEIEPIIVWTLDGAAIKISKNWNFELYSHSAAII